MADVSGLAFSLDPLMAEAKRRMWQRRLALAVVAVAAALVLAVQPWGGGGHARGVSASDTAIAQIPGMTRVSVIATGFCPGPHVCGAPDLAPGREESWILTPAYAQGNRHNVPVAFASAHPGPMIVTDGSYRLASTRQAQRVVRDYFSSAGIPSRPAPAVNGGVARAFEFSFRGTHAPAPDIRFVWASGPTLVDVTVVGAQLTPAEAQQIALLAHPR